MLKRELTTITCPRAFVEWTIETIEFNNFEILFTYFFIISVL